METGLTGESIEGVEARMLELDKIYESMVFPSLLARIKAVVFDFCIILIVFTITSIAIDAIGAVPDFLRGFILIFMVYLYDPVLTSFTGSTIGHKLMKLQVRRHNNPTQKISLGQAFIRFFVKATLGWLSFLTVTSNPRKRAIHDLWSGAVILHDKK